MSATERYTITVEPGQAARAKEALGKLGIEMVPAVPQEELLAHRETDHGNLYATASDIPGMLARVNDHLGENGLTPRVDSRHEGWTMVQRTEFLEMCLNEFEWEEGKIAHTEIHDLDDWDEALERWSELPLEESR